MDDLNKPRYWIIAVAAVLAAIMLYQNFGSWIATGVIVAALAALGWREWSRHGRSGVRGASRGPRCLKCGETLPFGARRCDSCGSASWTN